MGDYIKYVGISKHIITIIAVLFIWQFSNFIRLLQLSFSIYGHTIMSSLLAY